MFLERRTIDRVNERLEQLLTEWTHYEEAVCQDVIRSAFYRTCYKDSSSKENKSEEISMALMNNLASFVANKGQLARVCVCVCVCIY